MLKKEKIFYLLAGFILAVVLAISTCLMLVLTGVIDIQKPDQLVIASGSATKEYDGTPLTSDSVSVTSGSLRDGHRLVGKTYGSQTEVGMSKNSFSCVIYDETGVDVTHTYSFRKQPGLLVVVNEGMLNDLKGMLDGLDLGNLDFSSMTPEQIEAMLGGGAGNFKDMLANGQFDELFGKFGPLAGLLGGLMAGDELLDGFDSDELMDGLEIPDGNLGEDGLAGTSGQGGNFSSDLAGSSDGLNEEPYDLFRVTSGESGKLYFRYENFGNYTGSGFEKATPYSRKGETNPLYFVSNAFMYEGKPSTTVNIELLTGTNFYLPYYAYPTGIESNDIRIAEKMYAPYNVEVFYYDYITEDAPTENYAEVLSAEENYRQFVYEEYLAVDETLKNRLVSETAFTSSGKQLIKDIARYVSNAATYNLNFSDFPKDVDMVTYFLFEGKEGICQHYAASATMMYRSYGIPARYVVGAAGETVSGQTVTITSKEAHAWVEVYVDSLGWVAVEVTGGMSSQLPGEITLTTPSATKNYDGTPLTDAKWELLDGVILDGHSLVTGDVTNAATITAPGSIENGGFDYKILDKFGYDVTDEYTITEIPGTLEVLKNTIYVFTDSATKEYDGTPLTAPSFSFTFNDVVYRSEDVGLSSTLPEGHIIKIVDGSNIPSAINIGDNVENDLSVRVYDKNNDITDEYYTLSVEKGTLSITKIFIFYETASYEWIYDGMPHSAGYVADEDKLLSGHLIAYKTPESECPTVIEPREEKLNEFEIKIVDGSGNDVTDTYYELERVYVGTIKVLPIPVYVHAMGAQKYYDGTPLTNANYYIDESALLYGHTHQLKDGFTLPSITDVGKLQNELEIVIKDGSGNDVTDYYYDVHYGYDDLEILKLEIEVVIDGATKDFDGTPLTNANYSIVDESALLNGLKLKIDGELPSITEIGSIKNDIGLILVDKDDNPVDTKNYSLTKEFGFNDGYLTIKEASVHVQILSGEWVYDGTEHDGLGFKMAYKDGAYTLYIGKNEVQLPDGNVLIVTNCTKITNVGEIDNVIEFDIVNSSDVSVKEQYNLIVTNATDGKLKVTPAIVKLHVSGAEKDYDGTPLTNDSVTVEFNGDSYNFAKIDENSKVRLYGQDYIVLDAQNIPAQILVGITLNDIGYTFVESLTGASNYKVEYVYDDLYSGVLTVHPVYVNIIVDGAEKDYDGTPLVNVSYKVNVNGAVKLCKDEYEVVGMLANGNVIKLKEYVSDFAGPGEMLNVMTFKVYDSANHEVEGYNVTISYNGAHGGKLIINDGRKVIYVTTGSGEKIYDGEKLFNKSVNLDGYNSWEDVLPTGYTYEITDWTERTEVGSEDNVLILTIYNALGQDVTDSEFNVKYTYGTLTVKPVVLEITTGSKSKVYDGTPLKYDWFKVSYKGVTQTYDGLLGGDKVQGFLPSGHLIRLDGEWREITDLGTINNAMSFSVVDADGNDITATYDVRITYGKLTITKEPLKITTKSIVAKYEDGKVISTKDFGFVGELYENHEVVFDEENSILVTVDEVTYPVKNVFKVKVVDVTTNDDVSYMYAIEYKYGTLRMYYDDLTITTVDQTYTFNGNAQGFREDAVNAGEGYTYTGTLQSEHKLEYVWSKLITEYGTADNVITLKVTSDGFDVSYMYNINYVYGKLKMNPKEIIIKTASKTYNMSEGQIFNPVTAAEKEQLIEEVVGLHGSHEIDYASIVFTADGNYVGVKYNTIKEGSIKIYDPSNNNKDVSYNYSIQVVAGKLTITSGEIL